MGIIRGGTIIPGDVDIASAKLGAPALGTATAVHAAVADNGATQVITTGITNPDVPRNITATPSGTTANVTAVQCVITGTDAQGNVITETLPAFSAGAATAVVGSKAFATVVSISQPACGTSVSISYGTGAKIGLGQRISRDAIRDVYLGGVREATRATVAFDAVNLSGNTVQLNSALNGTAVIVDYLPV